MSGNISLSSSALAPSCTILGYRHIRRTSSTLRQLQKLRELKAEFIIQDTPTLVSAYNKAGTSHEHHEEFLHWIRRYIQFIREKTSSECSYDAVEFAQLAKIVPTCWSERMLLKDVFNTLCLKIRSKDDPEGKFIEALSGFLLAVDYEAFAGDPYLLSEIARDIMKKLGPEQTFSKGTYATHSRTLFALHYICAIIRKVDSSEFEHDKQEGLYQTMNRCLQNIIDSQSYYPFYYHATLLQQSLACMDSTPGISSREIWHRLLCAVKGTLYTFQAVAGAVCMNFAFDTCGKGIKHWIKACTGRRIKQNSWFENARLLMDSRILALNDPDNLDAFDECLTRVMEIHDETKDEGEQKALRFAMIHEVTFLGLECINESGRDCVVRKLLDFGKCCAPHEGWAQDLDIFEALITRVLNLRQKVAFQSDMERVIRTIRFHVRPKKLEEMIKRLEEEAMQREEDGGTSTSSIGSRGESLFNKIKKKMSLDESLPTRLATQGMLKTHYQQHSEVPSLVENEPSRHVNALDHSLLLYEKVLTPNGQIQVVKRPVSLEDLFKSGQVTSRTLDDKVKQLLLFGNPGTGKTTVARKIAYKWSVDEWGDAFDMLYLVPIRELSSSKYDDSTSRKQRNVQTAITNICFPGECDEVHEFHRSQVKKELEKESTLVVFDGLDEGDEMTKDIIKSTESKSCRVMILSRPQNLQRERDLADVEVECIGLDDEQLIKFIESECLSTELVEYLQMNPNVWEISHVPVVANILTFLYKTRKEDFISEESSFSMYLLYWKMSIQVWERYTEKTKSNARRDLIFEALEEIAFHALKDGHIFIGQEMVNEVNRDRQTSEVLKDSGFLLLKRECVYYQFPHLSFQEFFAGRHMAHSLLSKDKGKKLEATEFLKENKYCANFKQVFYFMIQALTLKKREEGYLEVESIINDGSIALGYQQHVRLSVELLEASFSASKSQDRDMMLDSTKILDRAFLWIESQECQPDALGFSVFASMNNPDIERLLGTSIKDSNDEFTNLFVQIARVARYIPDQWEKFKNMLKTDLDLAYVQKGVRCIAPLMRVIPEERNQLMELYWEYINHDKKITVYAALSYFTDIVRLIPSYVEQLFERVQSKILHDTEGFQGNLSLIDFPTLARLIPHRLQEILEMIKADCFGDPFGYNFELSQLGRLVEPLPESGGQVMELIRELSSSTKESKIVMTRSCLSLIKAMPENSTEIVEILWPLCEDEVYDVCDAARKHVIKIMLSWGEKTDSAVDALLRLSESQPLSTCSLWARLIAISYKLVEETHEGVDRLLTSLSRGDLLRLWEQISYCILDLIGTKAEKEIGLHWLHFMIVKAVAPSEIEDQDLHMMMDSVDSDPNKVAVKSAKLFGIAQFPGRDLAPRALCKVAVFCPEYMEELFDSIDVLTHDQREDVALEACVNMFTLLERHPQMTERVMSRLQASLHRLKCFHFLRMRESVSLDSLLKAYMMSGNNLLVFFIAWKSFDMPVIMETRRNGATELVVQTASNNKKKYKFQTIEQAQEFASSFDECIEVVFPDVASLVPKLGSQKRQHGRKALFEVLRESFTTYDF